MRYDLYYSMIYTEVNVYAYVYLSMHMHPMCGCFKKYIPTRTQMHIHKKIGIRVYKIQQ